MTEEFRLADGVGWVDFRDSIAVIADRTLVRFSSSTEVLRVFFERLGTPTRIGELELVLPGVDVADLLRRLASAGVVTGGTRAEQDRDLAPYLRHAIPAHRALRIGVIGDDESARDVSEAIRTSDRSVHADPEDADAVIVATSSPASLTRSSAECWRAGTVHLPLSPFDGRVVLLGPLAIPGHTACFDCLQLRRSAATTWPDEYWELMREDRLRRGWVAEHLRWASRTAVLTLERALVDDDDRLVGHVTAWNPIHMSMYSSRLWSVPRCPTCSPLETYSTSYPWSEPTPSETEYWGRTSVS